MMNFSLKTALSSTAFFIVFSVLFQQQWDYYDGFVSHLVTGIATKQILSHFYIYGFWGIGYFFKVIQPMFSHTNSVGMMVVLFIGITGCVFTYLIWSQIGKKDYWTYGLCSALVLMIMLPVFFMPSLTGISFLICGTSLFIMLIYIQSEEKSYFVYLIAILTYCFGMCIRQESGMGASLIVGLFLLLYSSNTSRTITLLIPFIFAGALISYFAIQSLSSVPFLHQTEKALYYIADGSHNNDFYEGLSTKDSMKAKAIEYFYINDETEITPQFINYLYKKKIKNQRPLHLLNNVETTWRVASSTILENIQYLFFNVFLFAWMLFRINWRILVFQISFWTIVGLLAFTIKLENRHYIYMSQLYTFGNVFFLIQIYKRRPLIIHKNILWFNYIVIIGLFSFSFIDKVITIPINEERICKFNKVEKEINVLAKDKVLLLDVCSNGIFHGTPLSLRKFGALKEVLYYDMAEMPLLPEYKSHLNSFCSCNSRNPDLFYDKLALMKGDLLIISSDYRLSFIKSYLKIVHHRNIIFQKKAGNFNIQKIETSFGVLNYYEISSYL
jgi:hypothetical protein